MQTTVSWLTDFVISLLKLIRFFYQPRQAGSPFLPSAVSQENDCEFNKTFENLQ
jgi:hypothetical protein